MKLRSLTAAWNQFFFAPQSPLPLALFRILYGTMVIITLILLKPDWLSWYGPRGWVSLATMHQLEPGTRLNLFTIIPQTDSWVLALFWGAFASALFLTAGFLTRYSSVVLFLCLTSIHQRNLYINHGGDTFLRVAGFFLMFAPAGAALSIDRWIRFHQGREFGPVQPFCPWAQRMIQFELAIMYFAAFCGKAQGAPWIDGTALYYVLHIEELRRFPVPRWLLQPMLLKLGTWSALFLEFALGTLIWIKELRYYILAAGVVFHLLIEYSLNIPLFEWDVLTGYILFVDPADLTRAWNRLRQRLEAVGVTLRRDRPLLPTGGS